MQATQRATWLTAAVASAVLISAASIAAAQAIAPPTGTLQDASDNRRPRSRGLRPPKVTVSPQAHARAAELTTQAQTHYDAGQYEEASESYRKAYAVVPAPELLTLILAVALSGAVWATLRYTDTGRALRAAAEDASIAAAFGVDQRFLALMLSGACAAIAGIAGVCIALSHTLAPSQLYSWIGVVFAAVMLGGLGRAFGPLVAGIVIGVSEAITMALTAPSWAPLVSFTLLIAILLLRPGRVA
jgi:branched-subunit amino acid ABC-type transport system permease component